MECRVVFGSNEIEYSVKFSKRKTLVIKVCPAGNVEVLAPVEATLEVIKQRVLKRAQWILQQQNYFKQLGERSPEKR